MANASLSNQYLHSFSAFRARRACRRPWIIRTFARSMRSPNGKTVFRRDAVNPGEEAEADCRRLAIGMLLPISLQIADAIATAPDQGENLMGTRIRARGAGH